MIRRIRDLDFDELIAQVASATDVGRRLACDGLVQADLAFVRAPADAIALLRDHLVHSVTDHTKTLDDIRFEDPLIQALVRAQHHPLANPLSTVRVEESLRGPDAGPLLRELIAAHPELGWDLDEIQKLVIEGLKQHGEHQVDDAAPPWQMHWKPASGVAYTLLVLVTLRTLGDIS
jgi:hypothetical protein